MKSFINISIFSVLMFVSYFHSNIRAQDTVPYPYRSYYVTDDTTCEMWDSVLPFGVRWSVPFYSQTTNITRPDIQLANLSITEPINDIYSTRIYGLAIAAKTLNPDLTDQFTTEISHELNFEGVIYSFLRGYSDVKLIKQIHCTIDSGQAPDKLLCDYRILGYLDRYSLPHRSFAYLPVYEFYFDEPIDVGGSILIGMKNWSDKLLNVTTFLYPYRNDRIFFGNHNVPNHHVSGDYSSYYKTCRPESYYCWIDGDTTMSEIISMNNFMWIKDTNGTHPRSMDTIEKINNYYGSFCFAITQPRNADISHPENSSNKITLMPNPATDWLTIRSDMSIEQVVVYDVMGRAVLQRSFDDKRDHRTLNVQHLINGVYIIKVYNGKSWQNGKLLKK